MARFRYDYLASTPSWLRTGDGELVQYTQGRVIDLFLERVRQSALARLPYSTQDIDSLGLIGSSLGFIRGSSETDDQFRTRISEWLEPHSHRTKGGYLALLRQITLVLGLPSGTRVKVVTRNGFWVSYSGGLSVTYGRLTSVVTGTNNGFWVGPDALPANNFAYAYIVIENHPAWSLPTSLLLGDPALWGGALGATDEVIGLGGAKGKEISDIRNLVPEWFPLGVGPVELLFNGNPAQPFPETGVDSGTAGLPNYATVTPTNLVRIPL
jgi:hypothetical protein